MILLALDTALEACSAAVCRVADGEMAFTEWSRAVGRGHAEFLMDAIGDVLDRSGSTYADIDQIAVTVGPGSFSGLRVGLSVARGLALALACPVTGVTTLAAIAAEHAKHHPHHSIAIALDARRDQVYCQVFEPDGGTAGHAGVLPAAVFAAELRDRTSIGLAGSGAPLVAAAALEAGIHLPVMSDQASPSIRSVAEVALPAGRHQEPLRPLYLRPPDAKPQAASAVARR